MKTDIKSNFQYPIIFINSDTKLFVFTNKKIFSKSTSILTFKTISNSISNYFLKNNARIKSNLINFVVFRLPPRRNSILSVSKQNGKYLTKFIVFCYGKCRTNLRDY